MNEVEWDKVNHYFSERIKKKTYRKNDSKKLGDLIIKEKDTSPSNVTKGLLTLTAPLAFNSVFSSGNTLEPIIDQLNRCLSHVQKNKPNYTDLYLKGVGALLTEIDKQYNGGAGFFIEFLNHFPSISLNIKNDYHDNILHVAKLLGEKEYSYLISPTTPLFACTVINNQIPRTVFKEYETPDCNNKSYAMSAETYVLSKFKENEKYLAHYSNFLECPKYKNQKRALCHF